MADGNSQLQWTDEQWNRVRQVVYEEARAARVVGNFLPLVGPLGPDASFVAKERLRDPNNPPAAAGAQSGFTVSDSTTLELVRLQTKVVLRDAQVFDPTLSSALIAFRRAANALARLEDNLLLLGKNAGQHVHPTAGRRGAGGVAAPNPLGEVSSGQPSLGLLPGAKNVQAARHQAAHTPGVVGEALVNAISTVIGDLEAGQHLGPFACVLAQDYFSAVQTPSPSLVLPQDRILPFLGGGALLRSSILPDGSGLVIALGGAPIDLVVGTDITVDFLQITEEPLYVFRVYEKIVLRLKEKGAVQAIGDADLVFPPPPPVPAAAPAPPAPVGGKGHSAPPHP